GGDQGGGDGGDQGGGDGGDQGGGDGGDQGGGGNHYRPVTTPATDAVLAMSSAPLRVLHAELEGFRAGGRAVSRDSGGVWGHYLGNKNHVNTSNGAAYRLSQSGFELGGDIATPFSESVLRTGLFLTRTDNDVRHERGGKSRIESWGAGTYAAWSDRSGFYVDAVLKGSRLNNKLNAVMTNGGGVAGSWTRYGISAALEAGYQASVAGHFYAEPFARISGIYVNDADVKLSNGMKASTGKSRSVETELGSRFSKEFSVGNTSVKPYIHAAVIQELATSNETVINQKHRFSNNTNGTRGRYGAGVSAELVRDTHFYADLSYSNGRYTESPVQSMVGIRTTF
ncbi:autotransporter outer membrane beta-barrel domain-containing protein, partial [Enterobacter hormaechei]|uniref:autotransporter outer membrane beta-barrel domain-containing protein n=1 Tax=Enterobacter hormaechei TaxID=158836 RepID=UPI0034CD9677